MYKNLTPWDGTSPMMCGYTIMIGKYYKKSFVDRYPHVLICKDHDGGCNLIHIRCCIWRTNIPSPVSDQVCHAVVKPRTMKHITVGYNSTGYQMAEQWTS